MLKTLTNEDTGIVHAVDDVFTDGHPPFALCGGIGPYIEFSIQRFGNTEQRNRAVTCKNCIRSLGIYSPVKVKHSKPVTPLVAVDAIIEYHGKLIVIERLNEPLGLAWPGGFVDVGESTENALHREVGEEVNLKVEIIDLVGVYSDPGRDPRGHTVSICYLCKYVAGHPKAKDDAKAVHLYTLSEALRLDMVLDHGKMLADALYMAQHPLRSRV